MRPKKNIWFLYRMRCLIDGVGDYFGITTRPFQREAEHRRKSSGHKLRAAIELYGEENFVYEVICRCGSEVDARQMERDAIREFNTGWPNGLNVMSSGPGAFKEHYEDRRKVQISAWADEQKRKRHSERLLAAMNTPDAKMRNSLAAKRRWADPEYRRKHVEAGKRLRHTEETKQKLREIKRTASAARGGPKGKPRKLPGLNASERGKAVAARPDVQRQIRETWEKNRERNLKAVRAANAVHNSDPAIIAKRTAGIKKAYQKKPRRPVSEDAKKRMREAHLARWAKIRMLSNPVGEA